MLDGIFRDHPGIGGRAARNDDDLVDGAQGVLGDAQFVEDTELPVLLWSGPTGCRRRRAAAFADLYMNDEAVALLGCAASQST